MANANSTTTYSSYDAFGKPLASSQVTSGQTYGFSYTYNAAGSLRTEQYPSGRVVETGYDSANRPAWVRGTKAGAITPYVGSANDENTWVHYWPHGGIYYLVRGNRVWHAGSFNSRLQPTESYESYDNQRENMLFVSCPNWGQHLNPANLPYYVHPICAEGTSSVQNNGNLRSYQEFMGSRGNPNLSGFSQDFSYDGINRLATASEAGGWSRSFGYDAFGNMWVSGQTVIATGGNTSNVYNSTTNRIQTVPYDNAGNQQIVNGNTLTYDAENRQVGATEPPAFGGGTEQYLYDGDGRRVAKTGPSGTTVYVYDAAGQLAAEYSNSATAASPCQTCYPSYDHLGSVRMVTDQTGAVVSRHDYLPFGEEIQNGQSGRSGQFAAAEGIQQRFTGKERDMETGLDYFGARYYGSALGRFTSPDPITVTPARAADPQQLNLYAYGRNNPLKYVDSTGMIIDDSACKQDMKHCGNDWQRVQDIANQQDKNGNYLHPELHKELTTLQNDSRAFVVGNSKLALGTAGLFTITNFTADGKNFTRATLQLDFKQIKGISGVTGADLVPGFNKYQGLLNAPIDRLAETFGHEAVMAYFRFRTQHRPSTFSSF